MLKKWEQASVGQKPVTIAAQSSKKRKAIAEKAIEIEGEKALGIYEVLDDEAGDWIPDLMMQTARGGRKGKARNDPP